MPLLKQTILHDNRTLSPELRALIEEAYDVFAAHSVGLPLGVCKCNCCCDDEHERLLVKTPLRQLSSAILSEYTNSAHGYDEHADGHALRYFLPRYLELIALNDPPHHGDLPHCLARLGTANYRQNWAPKERDLLDRSFEALLIEKLADLTVVEWPVGFRLSYPIEELIEMMVLAGANIERLLQAWTIAPNPGAGAHLAAFVSELHMSDGQMSLHSHYLTDHRDACRGDRPLRVSSRDGRASGADLLHAWRSPRAAADRIGWASTPGKHVAANDLKCTEYSSTSGWQTGRQA